MFSCPYKGIKLPNSCKKKKPIKWLNPPCFCVPDLATLPVVKAILPDFFSLYVLAGGWPRRIFADLVRYPWVFCPYLMRGHLFEPRPQNVEGVHESTLSLFFFLMIIMTSFKAWISMRYIDIFINGISKPYYNPLGFFLNLSTIGRIASISIKGFFSEHILLLLKIVTFYVF